MEVSFPPVADKSGREGGRVWTSERSWIRTRALVASSSADSAARFLNDCSLKFPAVAGRLGFGGR